MWRTSKFPIPFHISNLIPSVAVSVISGAIGIMISISYAALIFSGNLASHIATGIGIALMSAVVFRAVISLTSSFPGMIADSDALPTAILAISAVAIQKELSSTSGVNEEQIFYTLITVIALASVLTGLFLLTLGRLKFGGLIRFIPYPVIGGFLVGTGWLLIQGAMQVMTDITPSFSTFFQFFQSDIIVYWLFGAIVGILLFIMSRTVNHPLIVPGILVLSISLFYSYVWLKGFSIFDLQSSGWLFNEFPQGGLWQPFKLSHLQNVQWDAVVSQAGNLITIMIVSAVSIMLSVSSLEIVSQQDIEINQELESAGVANIISGGLGGMVGYQILADSVLAYKMGAKTRLVGFLTALICLVVLIAGASLFSYIPKPIFGGLLLFLGLDFFGEWIEQSRFKLSQADILIALLIATIIVFIGFLQGVAIGLILAVILFVINYSLTDVIKQELPGNRCQSNVQRFQSQEHLLQNLAEQIHVLKLQGFIFFGTANHLVNQIRRRMVHSNMMLLRFVILDFRYVSGLDSSAIFSFIKLKILAQQNNLTVIYTNVPKVIAKRLLQADCLEDEHKLALLLPSLDRGLEWCENQLLEEFVFGEENPQTLAEQLSQLFLKPEQVGRFMSYLIRLQYSAGELLFRQGEPSDGLYFLESGQVTVIIETSSQQRKRLRTFQVGTILGEMGIYDDAPRSASVVADHPSCAYFLSQENFKKMEKYDSALAVAFHRFIAQLLVQRFKRVQQAFLEST
ncbi:cyclic nucleotide-binding [Gloeothece citriformis PCC 7424]|uniref:Cyclic nucleotide-binding n=1 Tax=Gloeothece citriformis (strain PCC 7424) TaxID=65393 RepID=B7K841_GLOC7|nr:SulP family inorganic anion transporter [Gloeothece citriformis]ACK68529.1 cyclic nucleotide-binding [Gloeothece citriformis PCC 7424]